MNLRVDFLAHFLVWQVKKNPSMLTCQTETLEEVGDGCLIVQSFKHCRVVCIPSSMSLSLTCVEYLIVFVLVIALYVYMCGSGFHSGVGWGDTERLMGYTAAESLGNTVL